MKKPRPEPVPATPPAEAVRAPEPVRSAPEPARAHAAPAPAESEEPDEGGPNELPLYLRARNKRSLMVLPEPTITLMQFMALKYNTTNSAIVHMALVHFFVENRHLMAQSVVDAFLKDLFPSSPQQREDG